MITSIIRKQYWKNTIKKIKKDNDIFNMSLLHKGFLTEGDFPFGTSRIINGIAMARGLQIDVDIAEAFEIIKLRI